MTLEAGFVNGWLLSLSKQFLEPALSQALNVDVEERGSRMAPEWCHFHVHMVERKVRKAPYL